MKKRTLAAIVIGFISLLGASTLIYSAFTPDSENYSADESGSVSAYSETTVLFETTPPTTTATSPETVIDGATNKTSTQTTTTTTKRMTTQTPATTSTTPPTTASTAQTTAKTTRPSGNAPDFTVYDASGNAVSLSDFFGKPVVLNFWASWCGPCRNEMPEFQEMYEKYSGEGVVFLMVNLTDGSKETQSSASAFINSSGYTFPVYFDTKNSAADAYNISSIPTTFFISKSSDIAGKNIGQISKTSLENGISSIMG